MPTRKLVGVVAVAIVIALASGASHGWEGTRSSLTFSGAVALPNGVIAPGTYVFEVVNPATGGNIVSVKTDHRAYYMGFANRVERPGRMREGQMVTLGESGAGVAPPVLAWYPLNYSHGYAFIYPSR